MPHATRLPPPFPWLAASLTRFAIRFPLMPPQCASVIVGLTSAAQVDQICDLAQGVMPDPDTLAHIRALTLYPT